MAFNVSPVEYYYTSIEDRPGSAYGLLNDLASQDVNLLAISAVPIGPFHTQFALFPESSEALVRAAEKLALSLLGPQRAILVRGEDQMGAVVEVHRQLADAGVNVYAAIGVTDGGGRYGYVVHVRPDDFEAARRVLGA